MMARIEKTTSGGCLCAKVRFETTGDSEWNGYCHCRTCRSHTGAPVVAYVTFPVHQVRWTAGERKRYESSPGCFRSFCGDCGTPLTCEPNDRIVEFHVSTLDNPDGFAPAEHVHHGLGISWFEVSDELPRE